MPAWWLLLKGAQEVQLILNLGFAFATGWMSRCRSWCPWTWVQHRFGWRNRSTSCTETIQWISTVISTNHGWSWFTCVPMYLLALLVYNMSIHRTYVRYEYRTKVWIERLSFNLMYQNLSPNIVYPIRGAQTWQCPFGVPQSRRTLIYNKIKNHEIISVTEFSCARNSWQTFQEVMAEYVTSKAAFAFCGFDYLASLARWTS